MKKSGNFWPRVWILAGVMGMTVPITVLASEPEFARTTEEWERLRDNTLEYGEIGDLIHEYNVTVQNNQYEYTEFIKDYGKTRDEVADSYRELADELEASMTGEDGTGLISDFQLERQAKQMREQADNTVEDSYIYYLTYSQAEDSLVLSAQSKFLSYYKSQEELGSLIHRGNQNVQEMIRNTERTEQNYQEIRDYLRTEKAGANRDKKEAKDDGDMEGYAEFSMLEEIYSSAAKSYNDMIKKLNSTSSNQNRLQLEKQLTSAAQSLMISYQSVELQLEYMKKMLEVYKTQYNIAMLQNTSGAAVETDVQTAYNRWKDMEISVEELDNSRKEIHQSLCRILGVDETAEVSEISVLDVDSIPEADLESDTVKAIGNYRDLIDERHTNPLDTASLNKKKRTVTELEETVKIQMKQLYENISQAKQACRAAETGFDSAQIRWNNVQTQYAMGMLNQTEYLEEQAEYLQKKISYDGANLNLLQAVETYKWAVEGMITLD